MSLTFPSHFSSRSAASPEAKENLVRLQRVDSRGGKNQVATRVALDYFQRIEELRPGYFDGVKSWLKSGCVYVIGGTAGLGILGLGAYGSYKGLEAAYNAGYAPELFAGLGTLAAGGLVAKKLGYNPLGLVGGLLTLAVRDAANRAARWSSKQDEMVLKAKAAESKECHQEICRQLSVVYEDCAQFLHESFERTKGDANARIELKDLADTLDKKVSVMKALMGQLGLARHEIENILQPLQDRIHHIRVRACELKADGMSQQMNAELIAGWAPSKIQEIAVPYLIRERSQAAESARYTIFESLSGYSKAVLCGTATLACMGAAAFLGERLLPSASVLENRLVKGLLLGGPAAAVTIHKGFSHSEAVQSKEDYASDELRAATEELKGIYDGIASHLGSLKGATRSSMAGAIGEKLGRIRQEVRSLSLDANRALEQLEKTLAQS